MLAASLAAPQTATWRAGAPVAQRRPRLDAAARRPVGFRRSAVRPTAMLDLGSLVPASSHLGNFIGAFVLFYSSLAWAGMRRARIQVRSARGSGGCRRPCTAAAPAASWAGCMRVLGGGGADLSWAATQGHCMSKPPSAE